VRIGGMGEHFDNTKAVRELGLPLTPLEVTVQRTIDWFVEHGYAKGGARRPAAGRAA
jgi:dihydroflavonol-4-reductase